jgi:large subunit ribosomal protein L25
MDKIQLKAEARDIKTQTPKKVRKQGLIPAVLYGHKVQNQNLSVNFGEFEKAFKKAGESTIIELITADGKIHPVLIQDVQAHYLQSTPEHVDFYEVSMTEKLTADVSLDFVGESPAVKTMGGVLVKVLDEVEVECLPADLPHSIEVDVTGLKTLDDEIFVKDLKLPAKVRIITSGDELVIKVQPPRDVEAELATPVVEDVSKVEGAAETKPAAETAASEAEAKKEDKKA